MNTHDRFVSALALVVGGILVPLLQLSAQSDRRPAHLDTYRPSYGRLRDTLFILDTTYLEIRLDHQMIYQHFRSGRVDSYPCSTGDPRVEDGIATRPGIFTIQAKAKKALSQQFQVYLNYWMQFDGGIGIHGLQSRSYYRFLGRRVSSHGCVRISNETGSRLFGNVANGTVVFVHSGSPARTVAFADSTLAGLRVIYEIDEAVFKKRLEAVAEGRWDDPALTERLGLKARKRIRQGIPVGWADPKRFTQFTLPIIEHRVSPLAPAFPAPNQVRPLALIPTGDEELDEAATTELSGLN